MPKVSGLIQIQIQLLTNNQENFIRVSVTDNGCGISVREKDNLFKQFSKLDASSHLNPNGNGLGLYICRLICKSLGGDIDVLLGQNSGAKF